MSSNKISPRVEGEGLGQTSPPFDSTAAPGAPPTYATFSPITMSTAAPHKTSQRRSTILVHQKSPLLLATPPQITRALTYSHPFLLSLNKLAGLMTWTAGDTWESFLLLALFWGVILYGDVLTRMAGPVMVVVFLILGMYGRRFSPLSTSGWAELGNEAKNTLTSGWGFDQSAPRKLSKAAANGTSATRGQGTTSGHKRSASEITNTRHQKTLDEIVDTLREFTWRCNILLEPLLALTDFLSTQRTPTSATTKPALTTLFFRILLCTPVWVLLTLPPLRIITTQRVILVLGTIILTWHAKVARVTRELLWRSSTVRRVSALVTGLHFERPPKPVPGIGDKKNPIDPTAANESELTRQIRRTSHHHAHKNPNKIGSGGAGVKFTFIIYENQRRWVGLGWTASMFAYERSAWTDEHNNPVPPRDEFELPEVEDNSHTRWRWVDGSKWKVDGVPEEGGKEVDYDGEAGKNGWVYYDNKWQTGRRGLDGWGKWTRRRKWYRDAELVEVEDGDEATPPAAADDPETSEGTPTRKSGDSATTPPALGISYKRGVDKPSSYRGGSSLPSVDEESVLSGQDADRGPDDSSSLYSTSSTSHSLPRSSRRRIPESDRQRSRRASEARSEEEMGSLGRQLGFTIHEHGAGTGHWGFGDDAKMSLE